MEAAEREEAFILDGPLDDLTAKEIHGLGESGGEVDVPLFAGLTLNELDFGWETHGEAPLYLVIQLDTRKQV